jgi:O-antigen/teichoic acid export membrane protein
VVPQSGPTAANFRLWGRILSFAAGNTGTLIIVNVGTLLVRMISSVTLARLLQPSAFGLIGIITSIFYTVVMLTDLGFRSHVIRHPRGSERHFTDVIWTIHASRGIFIGAFCVLGSPVLAALLHKPELAWPLAAASLTLTINGFASLSQFTTLRAGGARRLSWFEFGLNVVSAANGIILAIWLRNAWSLVIAMIVASFLRTVLSYVIFPNTRHRIARDREISREFLAFSRIVLVSSALTLVLSQADRMVLARVFTLGEFGLYAIAINITSGPTTFASQFITRVAFPIYSKTWNHTPDRLKQAYYDVGRKTVLAYGFGCGIIAGTAPIIIRILYDSRYHDAALFLSIMMAGGSLKLQTQATADLMTAIGRVGTTVYANIVRLSWLAVAGTIGFLVFGPIGLIAAVGMIEVPALLYSWHLLRQVKVLSLRRELVYLATIMCGAAISGACTFLLLGLPFLAKA